MVRNNLWTTIIELFGLVLITKYARLSIMYLCECAQYGNVAKFFQLLSSYIVSTLIVLLYVKYGERRTITSMGFSTSGWVKSYMQGAIMGILLISCVAFLSAIFGEIEYNSINKSFSLMPFMAALFLSIINIREEVIFRGWFLTTPYSTENPIRAIVVGSVIFGVIHLGNANVTALSILNLMLFSVLLSEIFLIFKNIWIVAAIHTMWNFTQGKILGLPISGIQANVSLFDFDIVPNSLTGGFGLEANIFTLIILIIAVIITTKKIVYLYR